MKIYLTLIRPVFAYVSETWTVNEQDKKGPRIFERETQRKIFGPLLTGENTWRIQCNAQLDRSVNGADIVRFIEVQG
jgi:hypothetical protein